MIVLSSIESEIEALIEGVEELVKMNRLIYEIRVEKSEKNCAI